MWGTTAPAQALARDSGQVIYRISEEQAFTTVLDAYARCFRSRACSTSPAPGAGIRQPSASVSTRTLQKVLIVPAVGTDSTGREVPGYWFDVSGGGTAGISGSAKNRELFRRIVEALDATGTATVVTSVREGRYETDGRQYRAGGKDARKAAPGARSTGSTGSSGVADRLRELKTLRDQGLITDDEYEAKRRQRAVLDRRAEPGHPTGGADVIVASWSQEESTA